MSEQHVSVSRTIAADPDTIFDVLAHPARHAEIDGSGTVQASRGEPAERLKMGATFGMDMRMGLPYRIKNTVVEFEEGRLIAWRHMGRHVWRYELAPTDEGTVVTETFDWGGAPAPVKAFIKMMGYPDKHPVDMEATLERLAKLTEGTDADQAE